MSELSLDAPMSGWVVSLDAVDDPVFSGRMMGEGAAIDPTSAEVRAPCDGQVISVHAAGHAVTLRADNGAEILIHVGLETVALGGAGFTRHVADGERVKRGAHLLSVDLDIVAHGSKSLLTPVLVTNAEDFVVTAPSLDRRIEAGAPLLSVLPRAVAKTAEPIGKGAVATLTVAVPLAHGLHARPAALTAAEAKRHAASLHLEFGGRRVNAKSPVAIMTLGVGHGQAVKIIAEGADAAAAATALAELIRHGLPSEPPLAPVAIAATPQSADIGGALRGVAAAPGLAIGPAYRLTTPEIVVAEAGRGGVAERAALSQARMTVRAKIAGQAGAGHAAQRQIAAAHLAFLDDEDLHAQADAAMAEGASAGAAWRGAIRAQVAALEATESPVFAQRADDLRDIERQVLLALSGESGPRPHIPDGAILIADDLGPGQLMELQGRPGGLAMAKGGPTSHVAILAAALNIPAVVALGPTLAAVSEGAGLIVDGEAGTVRVAPDAAEIEAAQTRLAIRRADEARALAEGGALARLADGLRIEVFANLGSTSEAAEAVACGAEGCGLLRTEFLFLDRTEAPDETEQYAAYQAVADALGDRPLIIRTLDVGGDKPAPYLDLPAEDNPALGLRGLRVSLARPALFADQLRAILRVRPAGKVRILLPMVASLAELRAARAAIEAERTALGRTETISVGVMIETPAAAMIADRLAAEADFLSIGTNDLTQYALAMDRGNPQVAAGVDALHPAVLRLIAETARAGSARERTVAVCGGLAAEPAAAAILVGLGVTELSAPPAALPALKAKLRSLTLADCQALAARAVECDGPAEVRALLREE
jgi:phosphocarrier protein FPr/phosphocarrier protein